MTNIVQFSGEFTEYVNFNTIIPNIRRVHQVIPSGPSQRPEKAAYPALSVQHLSFNITERIITCMLQY